MAKKNSKQSKKKQAAGRRAKSETVVAAKKAAEAGRDVIGDLGGMNMDLWIRNARKNVLDKREAMEADKKEIGEETHISEEEALEKSVEIIPSKSFAHRALICAALAGGQNTVRCDFKSKDIIATKNCCAAIRGGYETMECNESGSTLRFLVPVMGALGRRAVFNAKGRLAERPLSPLREQLEARGMKLSAQGESPIVVEGQLTAGKYRLPGNVSSQFISGLLLALPLLDGDSELEITGKIESSAYIDITTEVINDFGVDVPYENVYEGGFSPTVDDVTRRYHIRGGQKYVCPEDYRVEGDWSGAAFWMAAGAIGPEPVTVSGLKLTSCQGDSEILYLLKKFGARVEMTDEGGLYRLTTYPSRLNGIKCDVSEIPDLAPVVALLGACAGGDTYILNGARLRLKESDRLSAIADNLKILGADVEEFEDSLTIHGSAKKPALPTSGFTGGVTDGVNDHRIVMMEAVASLASSGKVTINGHEAVSKSYPNFFDELKNLGLDDNLILK
ncbi:MAG: 3-phosphoshikimate 1-carboxyvinyltransferase [Eubacteriales bacterium]|nr:3-phosphoshikimate 1-carboxyvinyltransferase [Eubacteriales bacterium]